MHIWGAYTITFLAREISIPVLYGLKFIGTLVSSLQEYCKLFSPVQEGLSAMLTPYLSKQLSNNTPHETLKLLNSNSENPYLVWNNGTRFV